MRPRLLLLLLTTMGAALLALAVPLAASEARAQAHTLFLDRVDDTARFAALAREDASVDQLRLGEELRRYHEVYGIDAALLDRDGTVLLASSPSQDLGPQAARSPAWFRAAVAGQRTQPPEAIWPWARAPFVVAEPVVRGGDVIGVLVTSSPTDRARSRMTRHLVLLAVGELGALALCVLLASRWTTSILQPVARLERAAQRIAGGSLVERVPPGTGPPELRRLADQFNAMADSVQHALAQQRALVANTSHQLRNPLNALLLRLDDLSLSVPAAFVVDAENAAADGHRLARLLDQLLRFSQADAAVASGRTEGFDLEELVRERVAEARVEAAGRGIRIRVTGSSPRATGDRAAVASALDILLDNAVKFSPDGAPVEVHLSATRTTRAVTVRDAGDRLEDEELRQLGSPLWRSRRHQNVPGTGLGLSIARSLLRSSGARLEFDRAPSGGLAATVVVTSAPGDVAEGQRGLT